MLSARGLALAPATLVSAGTLAASAAAAVGGLEDQDGFARAWQLKATAICAT